MANGPSVLSRIGSGLISFGSGVPQIELDRAAKNIELQGQSVELNEQTIASNEAAVETEQGRQLLLNKVIDGGPESTAAMAELAVRFPEDIEAQGKAAGIITQGQKNEAADFAVRLKATPFAERPALINARVAKLSGVGRDAQHTASLIDMNEDAQNAAATVFEVLALSPEDRQKLASGGGAGFEEGFFRRNVAEVNRIKAIPEAERTQVDTDTLAALQVELRTKPPAVGSGAITAATEEGLTEKLAQSQAAIAAEVAFARTDATLEAELARADEVGDAAGRQAALVERAKLGERIAFERIKTSEEALILLPDSEAGAIEMVALLNEVRNDPNLANVLGAVEGRIDFRTDEAENALLAKIAQVTGKTFLQAYQSLKGGGPITDTEGKAATEAQSRLSTRTVSVAAYQAAIDELIGITDSRLGRLRRKAGPAQEAAAAAEAAAEAEAAQTAAPSSVGRFQIEVVQ